MKQLILKLLREQIETSQCGVFNYIVDTMGVSESELCQSYYDAINGNYPGPIPQEVIGPLSNITNNGGCCTPPPIPLDCDEKWMSLPLPVKQKFCNKCETDDLEALYGVEQLPWMGGPYAEFDASYCDCCVEKPFNPPPPNESFS